MPLAPLQDFMACQIIKLNVKISVKHSVIYLMKIIPGIYNFGFYKSHEIRDSSFTELQTRT